MVVKLPMCAAGWIAMDRQARLEDAVLSVRFGAEFEVWQVATGRLFAWPG